MPNGRNKDVSRRIQPKALPRKRMGKIDAKTTIFVLLSILYKNHFSSLVIISFWFGLIGFQFLMLLIFWIWETVVPKVAAILPSVSPGWTTYCSTHTSSPFSSIEINSMSSPGVLSYHICTKEGFTFTGSPHLWNLSACIITTEKKRMLKKEKTIFIVFNDELFAM